MSKNYKFYSLIYKNYFIDYNVYNSDEYSVWYHHMLHIFETLEEAKNYIDIISKEKKNDLYF